jgi:hypothetical protein
VYVASIIVELLDWDGQLKTLTFSTPEGTKFWVAQLNEYRDPRSGPFHLLEPEQEHEFARRLSLDPPVK